MKFIEQGRKWKNEIVYLREIDYANQVFFMTKSLCLLPRISLSIFLLVMCLS
jgi:hypothetical protein